jgi:hypothetical protein
MQKPETDNYKTFEVSDFRTYLVPYLSNFFFKFWPTILQNRTKHLPNFFSKMVVILHSEFWYQEVKKTTKRAFTTT